MPVDTSFIQESAELKTTVKQPARLVARLEAALATRDTLPRQAFRESYVRFGFWTTYRGGRTHAFYVAQGSTLPYGPRVYALDADLKALLRAYLPQPDLYLPLRPTR